MEMVEETNRRADFTVTTTRILHISDLHLEEAGEFAPFSKHIFPRPGRAFDTGDPASGSSPP
jgi:hypothetical protein